MTTVQVYRIYRLFFRFTWQKQRAPH